MATSKKQVVAIELDSSIRRWVGAWEVGVVGKAHNVVVWTPPISFHMLALLLKSILLRRQKLLQGWAIDTLMHIFAK